jgi:hypothetical protein
MELNMYKKEIVDLTTIKCGVFLDQATTPPTVIGSGV